MTATVRNYSLTGDEATRSIERGLAEAEWYQSPVDPATLARLHERTNGRAAVDAVLWVGLLVGSAWLAWTLRSSWWAIPVFAVYGLLYGGSADARWHEYGHATGFRSEWANKILYYPACFMLLREPTAWRWSHIRHHSDTIIVGRDPEIVFPRPFARATWVANLLGLVGVPSMVKRIVRHAGGRLDPAVASYVPEPEQSKVVREARIFLALLAVVVLWAVLTLSLWPLVFIGLPTFYGAWLVLFFGTTQHAGLPEDVLDHRLNSRTVRMNPVFRFLYLNMNYHIEHHMYPTVPYRNLPALHREIGSDLPEPTTSTIAAYREIFAAAKAQQADPNYQLPRVTAFAEAHGITTPSSGSAGSSASAGSVASPPDGSVQINGSNHSTAPVTAATDPVEQLVVDGGGWVTVCPSAELGPGEVRRFDANGATFALCRTADRRIYAVDGICTHSRRVHLAGGAVIGGELECPKHNGRFDLISGAPTRLPVCEGIATCEASEIEGQVRVRVGS